MTRQCPGYISVTLPCHIFQIHNNRFVQHLSINSSLVCIYFLLFGFRLFKLEMMETISFLPVNYITKMSFGQFVNAP
jgi:hypothetical protein